MRILNAAGAEVEESRMPTHPELFDFVNLPVSGNSLLPSGRLRCNYRPAKTRWRIKLKWRGR